MKKILIAYLYFFFIGGFLLTGGSPQEPGKDTLRVGINTFPASLNPIYVTDETSQAVVNKIYDSLFYFDCRGRIANRLVEQFSTTNQGKNITLELKKKIYFSNGRELNAAAVVSTIEFLKDTRFQYPYAAALSFIEKAEQLDKYSLALKLKEKSAAWRNYLTFFILDAGELKSIVPGSPRNINLSGTGFYRFKEIKEPTKIVLELNNPGENPLMYRYIEYIIVKNTGLAPLKLMNDEIDLCELQPENVTAYNTIAGWQEKFKIINYNKFGYTYLVFNLNNTNIDKDTRKFFYNLLTCGDFIEKFLAGRGEKVKTPFLLLNSKITPVKFKISHPRKNLSLKILTNSESKLRKDFVLFLRSELAPYHIIIEPLFLEYHSFLQNLKDHRFDIAVSAFLMDIDYDMKDAFHSDSYFNYANFKNPGMDAILEQGLQELDDEKREKIYLAAHQAWLNELPIIPLFNLYYYTGVSREIPAPAQTYQIIGGSGDFLFNIEKWVRKADHK